MDSGFCSSETVGKAPKDSDKKQVSLVSGPPDGAPWPFCAYGMAFRLRAQTKSLSHKQLDQIICSTTTELIDLTLRSAT
jgi:hypothetical protein